MVLCGIINLYLLAYVVGHLEKGIIFSRYWFKSVIRNLKTAILWALYVNFHGQKAQIATFM
jgi:hypothetical protein